jgi:hypothetical protein
MGDSDEADDEWRMTVVCTDGTEIGCTNFKAVESGVLLTDDLEKNRVFGFVSHDEVRFVLPAETADRVVDGEEDAFDDPLKELPGLGSTYAKRLQSAGYDSLADVAAADPETLADETGAHESETQAWVEQASEMTNENRDDGRE